METRRHDVMGNCRCHSLPPKGKFIIGKQYVWEYIIGGVLVEDETQIRFDFSEIGFLMYFKK